MKDMEKAFYNLAPLLVGFLAGCWDLLMKGLVAIKVMPFLRKSPWLLVALLILLMIVLSPIAVLIAAMAIVALIKEVKAYNDFMITPVKDASDIHDVEYEKVDR